MRKRKLEVIGCEFKTNNSGILVVTDYINNRNVGVRFTETGFSTRTTMINITKGQVYDKKLPRVYGVGFIGDGKYPAHIKGVPVKAYKCWLGMLERCYSEKLHKKFPTYKDCSVCDEWHDYQKFAEWYNENYPLDDGKYQLDKDKLIKGNRVYSPQACCFLPPKENTIISQAKYYKFISPDGKKKDVFNLSDFCRDNGLTVSAMCNVNNGKRKSHKGWMKDND